MNLSLPQELGLLAAVLWLVMAWALLLAPWLRKHKAARRRREWQNRIS